MLPESWIPEAQDVSPALQRPSCRAPITDVLAWTECFALMAAVIAEKFPDKGQPRWPMTASTDARHWLDTALTGPRRTLPCTTRPLWAMLKRSPGAITARVSFTPQRYAQNSSSRGGHGHQSMQWVCCRQGSTRQDRNRNHAGSSTRTGASCGGVDTSIFALSAASHTR